jgi:hypothetical protein
MNRMKRTAPKTVISLTGYRTTTMTIALSVLALGFAGCISAPPKRPTLVEVVKQENEVGSKLAKRESFTSFRILFWIVTLPR